MSDTELTAPGSRDHVCVNYLDFLAASCKKRWSFVDAIYGVIPFFGIVTRNPVKKTSNPSEELKELALQILSTQVSDEINIARLIALAEQQQIVRFDILLPYALTEQQLDAIRAEYEKPLNMQQSGDKLIVWVA